MNDIHLNENEPITVALHYEVLEKDDDKFKLLMREVVNAAKQFQGFRGKHFFYTKSNNKINYYIMMQFDNFSYFKIWEESNIRAQLRNKINQLLGKTSEYHYLTGLESWFSLGVDKPIVPPPRYKIAFLTWVSVYCLLIIIYTFVGSYLNQLIMPMRVFIVSIIMVFSITYLIMPLLTRLLKKWLYPAIT